MGLKNLMVHLDQSERAGTRLALAVSLAKAYQARLVGVFGQRAEPKQVGVVATWPSEAYTQAVAAVKAQFEQAAAGLAETHWHDVNRGGDAELVKQITAYARFSDLMVLGQNDEAASSLVPLELPEEVMAHAGRPILVLPYAGNFHAVGKRPIIAWNGSRESARALNDALPLIAGCQEAILLSLEKQTEESRASSSEVAAHLRCHGIAARAEVYATDEIGVMDMVLNAVTDHDADLLVMGGRGPSGLPFGDRGAGTRHILGHMTVPVLMSS